MLILRALSQLLMVGRLHKHYMLFAGLFLGRIITILGSNVHCHLFLRCAKHVPIFALVSWADGEDVILKVLPSSKFRCLSRHIGWSVSGSTSLVSASTSCTASSTTSVFSLSHLKMESLGFSFLGIHCFVPVIYLQTYIAECVVRTTPCPVCTCSNDSVDWAASANMNSCK